MTTMLEHTSCTSGGTRLFTGRADQRSGGAVLRAGERTGLCDGNAVEADVDDGADEDRTMANGEGRSASGKELWR